MLMNEKTLFERAVSAALLMSLSIILKEFPNEK